MDAMEAILTRRSIRRFTGKKLSSDTIHRLLEAAMSAPSSQNEQPWHFVVIRDRKTLDRIPTFHPYSTMIKEAQLAVVVCADTMIQENDQIWIQDCSAATENLLIAARALGLGSVWLGVYPLEPRVAGLRELIKLPDFVMPLCIIALGYPGETKSPVNRFDHKRVHPDKW